MTVLHTMDLRGIDASAAFKKTLDAIAEDPSVDLYALLFGKEVDPISIAATEKENNQAAFRTTALATARK